MTIDNRQKRQLLQHIEKQNSDQRHYTSTALDNYYIMQWFSKYIINKFKEIHQWTTINWSHLAKKHLYEVSPYFFKLTLI